MNDIAVIATAIIVMLCSVSAYFRARYWARRAESAAEKANLAYFRAHDFAMEAEQNANRT